MGRWFGESVFGGLFVSRFNKTRLGYNAQRCLLILIKKLRAIVADKKVVFTAVFTGLCKMFSCISNMLLIAELSAHDLEKKSQAFILSYLFKRKKTEDFGRGKIQGLFSYSSQCSIDGNFGINFIYHFQSNSFPAELAIDYGMLYFAEGILKRY